jgi:serine/threonine protein kinase
MTRPEQDDDGRAPRERAKSVIVELSNSPAKFLWDESTPSREVETKTSDKAVHVKAIVDVETKAKAPSRIAERYKVVAELGVGGQAHVYLAEDTTLRRKVAIKISKPDRPLSQAEQEQFKREAQAIAALKHPGIVTVHDFGIHDDGRCFIVLEYLPGQSLKDCLKNPEIRKTFTIERTLELISRVAEALHYAHQRGIYHRDLKPGNILLDEHGNPHISDFGLAVTHESQRGLKGQVAGTIPYMAPEQVRGEAHWLNGQADIWALGVILYEMLAGRRPFQGEREEDVKEEILCRTPTPLRQIDDRIPREVEEVVMRCLNKVSGSRHRTAEDFGSDIRKWITVSRSPAEKKSLIRIAVIPVAILGMTSAAIGIVLFYLSSFFIPQDAKIGEGQTPNLSPTTVLPTLTDGRRLKPGISIPLLDRPPRQVMWPANDGQCTWEFNPSRQMVTVETKWAGLLQLESLKDANYDFQVEIQQPRWKSNASVGVFVGHRQIGDSKGDGQRFHFQAFVITSNDGRTKMPFSLDRTYIFRLASDPRSFEIENTLGAGVIKPKDLEWLTLKISVRGQKIASVFVDGNRIPDLTPTDVERQLIGEMRGSDLRVEGGIGLFVGQHGEGMTGKFRNAELKIIP